MFLKAPRFWYGKEPGDKMLALALRPLSCLYAQILRLRERYAVPAADAPVPVICVGNLTVGGTGKTPTVIALARLLVAAGRRPHILSRGHGGRLRGPVRVDPERHSHRDVGDEPLLLAAAAPTWVARDRAAGARAAVENGADILLMDDGFQNLSLHKDLSLLVIDAAAGFGNGFLLPAGPLREEVSEGLARAQGVVVIGGRAEEVQRFTSSRPSLPVLHARVLPDPEANAFRERRAVAFAGIGRPEKFLQTLQSLGMEVAGWHAFPDHAPYKPRRMWRLIREASAKNAWLVTTVKDAVRVPRDLRSYVRAVPVSLRFTQEEALMALLAPLLARPS